MKSLWFALSTVLLLSSCQRADPVFHRQDYAFGTVVEISIFGIAENRVGRGKMLICAIDLLGQQDRPEARQLLHSLLRYLDSAAFVPRAELDSDLLKRLFPDA